jgi:hypothetical protein
MCCCHLLRAVASGQLFCRNTVNLQTPLNPGNSTITINFSGQTLPHGVSTSVKSVKNSFIVCEISEIHKQFRLVNLEVTKIT